MFANVREKEKERGPGEIDDAEILKMRNYLKAKDFSD